MTIGLSQEKPVVSSGPTTQTGTLGKLTQTRWPEAAPWGRHTGEAPTLDVTASPTRAIWSPDASRASPGAPTQPRESSHPLMVIIPLTVALFLLIVTVVASCVWLLGQKAEKAKPLIKSQINLEPPTAAPRPERSATVPAVTVTPLLRSSGSPPVSLFRAPPCGCMEKSPASEPAGRCAPWETWVNLDPDMVTLCRQTNPALKHNQSWVRTQGAGSSLTTCCVPGPEIPRQRNAGWINWAKPGSATPWCSVSAPWLDAGRCLL